MAYAAEIRLGGENIEFINFDSLDIVRNGAKRAREIKPVPNNTETAASEETTILEIPEAA